MSSEVLEKCVFKKILQDGKMLTWEHYITNRHCVKSVQLRNFFWSVFSRIRTDVGKYGPEKTPYLDTFHAVAGTGNHLFC